MQITVEKIMVLWYTILLHKQKTGRKEGDTVPEKSFDVARNIRMTQELQCQMLAQVADLFTAMHNNPTSTLLITGITLHNWVSTMLRASDGIIQQCSLFSLNIKG